MKKLSSALVRRLKKIKLLILDVDGVLTDGKVFWVDGTGWTRFFNVKDGYGIRLLMDCGIDVAIVSGGDSRSVRERAQFIGIKRVFLGDKNKMDPFKKILEDTGFKSDEIAFIGDELFDIPVLKAVGFAATVPDAPEQVKKVVHYVTKIRGGEGAVREVTDYLCALNTKTKQERK